MSNRKLLKYLGMGLPVLGMFLAWVSDCVNYENTKQELKEELLEELAAESTDDSEEA